MFAKYLLTTGTTFGSNITQETIEFGEKPLALILILNPSAEQQSGEITTLDSSSPNISRDEKNDNG